HATLAAPRPHGAPGMPPVPPRGYDGAMAIAQVGEFTLSYERAGTGEPLLLIMGMSGTARHWGDPFLDALRRDFDVIVFDHRGVGESTPLPGGITIAEMAQDAVGLLDVL